MSSTAKWPEVDIEFSVELFGPTVRAKTDTGRPGTPIYTLVSTFPKEMSEEEAEAMVRAELQARFEKAHPNGIPSGRPSTRSPRT